MTSVIVFGLQGVSIDLNKLYKVVQQAIADGVHEVTRSRYKSFETIGVSFPQEATTSPTTHVIVNIYITKQLTLGQPEVVAQSVKSAIQQSVEGRTVVVHVFHPDFTL